jgi:hypothetical protein
VATYVAMPRASGEPPVAVLTNTQVGQRMALTLVLVAALAWAAHRFGPLIGGTLAALPVLASILAVTTHRQQGAPAMIALLRGMVAGMGSFVVFCLAVALLVVPATAASFAIALAAAIAVQLMALGVVQPDALSDREHRRRRQRPGLPGAVARARH